MPKIKELDVKHPEWKRNKEIWMQNEILYAGGDIVKENAAMFLRQRPKELPEIFQARLEQFRYQNILAVGLDWYLAKMFGVNPELFCHKIDKKTLLKIADDVPDATKAFYTGRFLQNADGAGATFVDFFRSVFQDLLLFGRSYVLTDKVSRDNVPENTSLALENQLGLNNPYLVNFCPLKAIRWKDDIAGNLEWIVFATRTLRSNFLGKDTTLDRWLYYDKQDFRVYEAEVDASLGDSAREDVSAELVREGKHSLSTFGRVPVRRIEVPRGLWLANRVYLTVLDHLNTDNAFGWALFMACLALPVIITDGEINLQLSESGYLKLPIGSSYEWTEPKGTTFDKQASRVSELREEVFRQMYLLSQNRSDKASDQAASGFSKQMDSQSALEVLNELADVLRAGMQIVMQDVSDAKGDTDLRWDIRNLDFSNKPVMTILETIDKVLGLEIPSVKLRKMLFKRVARLVEHDANEEVLAEIDKEIEEAPDDAGRSTLVKEDTDGDREKKFRDGTNRAAARLDSPVPEPGKAPAEGSKQSDETNGGAR